MTQLLPGIPGAKACSQGASPCVLRASSARAFTMVLAITLAPALALALALAAAFAPLPAYAEEQDLTTGTLESIETARPPVKLESAKDLRRVGNNPTASGTKATSTSASEKPGNASFVPYVIHPDGSITAAIFPFIPNPTTDAFIASIGEHARAICQREGLYASVMIAQAILESGSGSSGLSKPPYNNLFGIKGSYKGSSVVMMTSEDDGSGGKYDISAGFRSYPSVKESLEDYADLLKYSMGDFYAPAWKANAKTYVQACDYLQGRYATDTTYSGQLQGIIIAYDLVQYDHPKGWDQTSEARKEKSKGMLHAYMLGGKVMRPLQVDRKPGFEGTMVEASVVAESQKRAALREAADLQERFAAPLGNPGVQLSLAGLAGLAAFLARNEIAVLLGALKKAAVHLPFLGR